MTESWILEETKTVDLKDARTEARLRRVLAQLAHQPAASIPAACGGHADMTAAYRLFDNPDVTFEGILDAHADASVPRIGAQPVVLLVQDTTEINVTRPTQQVRGAGPMGGRRRGLFLHLLHAFTPDGTPLGTVRAKAWTREESRIRCAEQTRGDRERIPIEQKESHRWIQMQEHAQGLAAQCPQTQLIVMGDSEADLYELFQSPSAVGWIVRGCQNRALQSAEGHLRERLEAQPVRYRESVPVLDRTPKFACDTRKRKQPQTSRTAEVEVRACAVALRPPKRPGHILAPVTVNVVWVREAQPPASHEPIEWMLLTNLPIESDDQLRTIVGYYKVRWMIEILFRVLKSGCRVEQRRFESLERVQNMLAVYLIIAWRVLFTVRLARAVPTMSCEVVFHPDEWRSVWRVLRQTPPPKTPPPLAEMTELVAQLGGYIPRKNSPPGPQTIWIGLQRAHDFAICWRTFGPDAQSKTEYV